MYVFDTDVLSLLMKGRLPETAARRLDDADLRIAAICSATDHVLVSGKSRHFERIPGLKFENWLLA